MTALVLSVLFALSLGGIYIGRLIMLYLVGHDNPIGRRLCPTVGQFDCEGVLQSRLGKITTSVHIGDLVLVYFVAQILFIVLSIITGRSPDCIAVLSLPCLISTAIALLSLYCQAIILKTWCKLCLVIALIVGLQSLTLAIGIINLDKFHIGLSSALLYAFSMLLAGVWLVIKSAIVTAVEARGDQRHLLLFKKNTVVFRALLRTQRQADTRLWDDDFHLGKRDSLFQFMAVINPYCPACGREYKQLLQLLEAYPQSIGIAVRFAISANIDNRHTKAARLLLCQYFDGPVEAQAGILKKWFAKRSLAALTAITAGSQQMLAELLTKHEDWWRDNHIQKTPSVFLNGHEIPGLYSLTDLNILLPKLITAASRKAVGKIKNV